MLTEKLDEALGLKEMGVAVLTDIRQGSNNRYQLFTSMRQSFLSRLAGYEDVFDAERLCLDGAEARGGDFVHGHYELSSLLA